jgi:membrane-bound lytic murein transglycosylase D
MWLPWYKLVRNILIGISYALIQSATFAAPNLEGIQVYQKNLHLSEEHMQKLADDIDRYHNANNLWVELREEFSLPHYEDTHHVQHQINWYLHHQDDIMEAANRAGPYLYFILQQARMRHLPAEVVLLPMIESAYNPFAYSSAGAAGIWQMMPGTASGLGIKQDWWYDGRRDVVASTRAALDYLSYLGSFFEGNWLLAIAAYDTGEGNVLAAIKKNIREGKSTDFWSLPLAQETRNYVPRLLALATIISHPELYPVPFPGIPNAPYLAQIDIGGQIHLKHAAVLAGMSLKQLKDLNPGFTRPATAPNGPSKLVLPIENIGQFSVNLAHSPEDRSINWLHHKAKNGDTLASIAQQYNLSTSVLQKANPGLANNFKAGDQLLIPRQSISPTKQIQRAPHIYAEAKSSQKEEPQQPLDLTSHVLESIQQPRYVLQPGDTLYMVRKGDTLEQIARRFHVETKNILAVNDLRNKKTNVGDKLIVPTHLNQKVHKYEISPGDTVYMVRKGDSLEKVANKFHTTPAAIRVSNLMSNSIIQEGDRLVIPAQLG